MVEVVMAIFIFGIVIVGVVVGMGSSLNLTRGNRSRSVAANLASEEMDTVRSTDFVDLPLGQVTSTQTIDNVPYTITRESEWVIPNATNGPCQAPANASLAYLAVDVAVTWPNMAGVQPISSNTVVTPPVGTYDPTSGHVAVTVRDRNGVAEDGVLVSLGGPVNDSQMTTSDGCAFFAFEPPGSYTVALSGSGFVNDQGIAAPSQSATIKAGSVVSVQFQYDQAATLLLTLQGNNGYAPPSNITVSVGNTHILPTGTKWFAGTGSPRTISGLFPYSDGYEVWAGGCSDADPEGVSPGGSPYYSGASRAVPIAVTPGAPSVGAVMMPEVAVTVKKAGASVPGYDVTVTHVTPSGATSDPGCPTAESYALGTSGVNGIVNAAVPYGTWTVTATKGSSTGSATVTLSPLDPATPKGMTVNVT